MLPEWMQFNHSLTVATVDPTTMQFRSGESVVITVRGNAVPALIPALIDELRHPRSWPDVVAALDDIAAPDVVTECVGVLFEKGVFLEPPAQAALTPGAEDGLYQFFAHAPHEANEILRRIGTSRLGTMCEDGIEKLLHDKLGAHGFARIVSVSEDPSRWKEEIGDVDLLISVIPHLQASALDAINRACLEMDTAWLPADVYSGTFCALGPLVVPGLGPCYECYRSRVRSNLDVTADAYDEFIEFQRATQVRVSHYGMLPAGIDIALGIVCLEAVKFLTEFAVPACVSHNVVVDLVKLDVERHRVLRIPRCAVCSGSDEAAQGHWTV